MATIPDNPTWPEIRAGMEAARDLALAARQALRAPNVIIDEQRAEAARAQQADDDAMQDIKDWEAALRRKLLRGL